MESADTGGPGTGSHDASAPLALLVGSGRTVPCLGGVERPAVRARPGGLHPGPPGRRRAGRRLPALVLERPPRGRLPVAPRHPRLRGGPAGGARLRRTGPRRRRRGHPRAGTPRRPSTTWPTGCASTPTDVVVTTVVEHHANLLPWGRVATRRYVECGPDGTFGVDDVTAALDAGPVPRRCWPSPAPRTSPGGSHRSTPIIDAAHARGVPVLVDAAQLAPHRAAAGRRRLPGPERATSSTPRSASGALIGPRAALRDGRPLPGRRRGRRSGGTGRGDLDRTTRPRGGRARPTSSGPSPSMPPSTRWVALGWDAIVAHEQALADRLLDGLAGHRRGPPPRPRRRRRPPGDGDTSRWPPSPSTACTTRWWPPGSVPSTASPCATAASAPTPTSSACSAWTRRVDAYRREVLARRPPGRPGGGPGQRRARHLGPTTSTPCWRRWPTLAGGTPAPVPYEQDRPPATSSP